MEMLDSLLSQSFENESNDDILFCQLCQITFTSLHNKRSHYSGRIHTDTLLQQLNKLLGYRSAKTTVTKDKKHGYRKASSRQQKCTSKSPEVIQRDDAHSESCTDTNQGGESATLPAVDGGRLQEKADKHVSRSGVVRMEQSDNTSIDAEDGSSKSVTDVTHDASESRGSTVYQFAGGSDTCNDSDTSEFRVVGSKMPDTSCNRVMEAVDMSPSDNTDIDNSIAMDTTTHRALSQSNTVTGGHHSSDSVESAGGKDGTHENVTSFASDSGNESDVTASYLHRIASSYACKLVQSCHSTCTY